MDGWAIFWTALTLAIIITDFIANKKKGATLSEHLRELFARTFFGVLVFTLTLVAFWVHIILNVNVWPLVFCGALIGILIVRKENMNPLLKRVLVSLGFVFSTGIPLYTAATLASSPGGVAVTEAEWGAIIWAALVAGYANFKSNTTVIMPNRTVWTSKEREVNNSSSKG